MTTINLMSLPCKPLHHKKKAFPWKYVRTEGKKLLGKKNLFREDFLTREEPRTPGNGKDEDSAALQTLQRDITGGLLCLSNIQWSVTFVSNLFSFWQNERYICAFKVFDFNKTTFCQSVKRKSKSSQGLYPITGSFFVI